MHHRLDDLAASYAEEKESLRRGGHPHRLWLLVRDPYEPRRRYWEPADWYSLLDTPYAVVAFAEVHP